MYRPALGSVILSCLKTLKKDRTLIFTHVEFSGHAIRRMFERGIEKDAVIGVILHGEIIADYPDDLPYPSVLILGRFNNKPIHVVIGFDPESNWARVITVYCPDPDLWNSSFKTRRIP